MISILLATTGRPDMAEATVRSIRDTTEAHDVEIVVAVDADPDTAHRLRGHADIILESDTYRGCSRAWNDCLAASKGDPVILAADDLAFQPGWLTAALDTLSRFPGGWGFVGFNDGHRREDLSTHYMVSRRLIVEEFGGVIAWEHYAHSFNDEEANARARRAGRYAWCEDARVYHNHWIFGDRVQDNTDARSLVRHPASQRAFLQRQAAGFPNDFKAVI